MATTLPNDMQLHGTLKYVDSKGNPAAVDGVPVWSTDHTDLITLVVSADGMSVDVAAVGPAGSAQITVEADADLGAGVESLITLAQIDVVGGKAVTGTIEFGEPVPAP